MRGLLFSLVSLIIPLVYGQTIPGSYPHDYPGKPDGHFSPDWQSYYQVTDDMPNVTFPLGRNWAGNIPVNRPGHPNDTLFFWGVEKENGSLTASAGDRSNEPWGIWLNGGWDHLADYIWVDQPV
ncbi:hypothetical protein PHLCEN_2v12231 [Hermanssonia centrifuga]|uniref:Uncharacterized protein n=1 Tax=Hermanssonia centrifuga TaxID=98765 RepID=A0A2R6NHL6_9APHY|nr:hypothetical protein PHLCEN_2v12231 [Hermanssonia centrifuga]